MASWCHHGLFRGILCLSGFWTLTLFHRATKNQNPTNQETLHKTGPRLYLWDSGRWEWWGIIMGWTPVEFWHHLVSQNLKTLIFLLFSQSFTFGAGVQQKVNDLLTSPINQFRDYFIRNRLEKLVPLNYRFPTDNKKSLK